MMRKTVIWFDADGVLLDFYTPFKDFCGVDEDFQGKFYDMHDMPIERPTKSVHQHIDDFIQTDAYEDLMPLEDYDGTDRFVDKISALKNLGFELRVITQAPEHARYDRIMNLSRYFGDVFSGIHFVSRGECKLGAMNSIIKDIGYGADVQHILVEDNPDTLMKAVEFQEGNIFTEYNFKLSPVCIMHSYNTHELEDAGYTEHDILMCTSTEDFCDTLIRGYACLAR